MVMELVRKHSCDTLEAVILLEPYAYRLLLCNNHVKTVAYLDELGLLVTSSY